MRVHKTLKGGKDKTRPKNVKDDLRECPNTPLSWGDSAGNKYRYQFSAFGFLRYERRLPYSTSLKATKHLRGSF